MIRPMTNIEIQAALRHGAQVCIERDTCVWAGLTVLPQDGAFFAADALADALGNETWGDGPESEQVCYFLLLVAEAIEP